MSSQTYYSANLKLIRVRLRSIVTDDNRKQFITYSDGPRRDSEKKRNNQTTKSFSFRRDPNVFKSGVSSYESICGSGPRTSRRRKLCFDWKNIWTPLQQSKSSGSSGVGCIAGCDQSIESIASVGAECCLMTDRIRGQNLPALLSFVFARHKSATLFF